MSYAKYAEDINERRAESLEYDDLRRGERKSTLRPYSDPGSEGMKKSRTEDRPSRKNKGLDQNPARWS